MKINYEGYEINSNVWAVSEYLSNDTKGEYISIFPAKVIEYSISYDKKTNSIKKSYWLSTPDGQEWGDSVDEDNVNDDFYVLVEKYKKIWIKQANNF